MENEPTLARDALASDTALDGLASDFQSQWNSGHRPQIQDFLSRVAAGQRAELLARLMRLEMDLQSRSGETFAVRNYREQFAEYSDVVEQVLAEQSGSGVSGSRPKATRESTVGRADVGEENTTAQSTPSSPSRRSRGSSVSAAGGAALMQFGDYEILSEIARGGMGVVYKARQVKLNRIVALKMILSGQFASEADVQRFYSEAEAAAKLDHPGIVPIYEVDEHDGRHFFSMAYIDGLSLQQRVAQGPLPPREAAQLMRQVAAAVHYAHEHGVIHRDLKPRNILLTSDGQPKVTDFGLAKRIGDGSDLTVSGQAIGTPGYMPPEQAAGKLDEIGPTSDVYGLGCILYCLLTGRPPFQSASVVETIKQAIETPPVPPRMLNPAIDRDLETVCLKCLEKDPVHRYASAAELGDELQRYLDGEPIKALRAGSITRSWRWLKRRPLVAALGASLAVLAVVIALSATVAQRAITTYRLTNLQRSIESRLDAPDLTAQWLAETDQLIVSLSKIDPALQQPLQSRLNDALAGRIREEIRRPKLDDEIVRSIESAIAIVDPRNRVLAQRLRGELGRRQRDWQTVFQLRSPFTETAAILPAGSYQLASQRLVSQATGPVLLATGSEGLVRIEARFDESWEDAERLGVAINAQPDRGYDFILEVSPNRSVTEEDLPTPSANGQPPPKTFREVRKQDGYFRLAMYRNGRLLLEHELHHTEVPSGQVAISGSREQGELRIQVNTLPARLFRDPFPLPARQKGAFGLHWPGGIGLVELRASEKLRATSVSPLEEGDELFEQGKYADALEHYQRQARETDDAEFLQEALHKQGMCLFELGRLDEAAAIFEPLSTGEGERWPPLAGCHLWVIRLRQKREAQADAIFDTLSTRYRLDQFAALIPQELANEIRNSYQSKLGSLASLIRYNPDLVRDHERLAAVDRFFSPDGRGSELTQMEVARAYHLLGDIPTALQAAEAIARDTRHGTVMRHYVRLLRLNGEAQRGLEELQRYQQRVPPRKSWEDSTLELEWARVYAALGQMRKSEDVVDRLLERHRLVEPYEPRILVYVALLKGVLLDRRGARGPAEEIWREGYLAMQPLVRKQAEPNSEIINALILGSLCGEITDEDCQAFSTGLMSRGGDNAFARQAQALVNPQTMAAALRQMWRTPLGRKYAEAFAFETLTLGQRVRVPVVLTATEFINQSVHGGQMTAEQQQVTFDAVGKTFEQAIFEGKVSISQVAQLILTWKGIANFLGWGGVSASLDPEVRGGLAYIFGHRYLALGDKTQAVRFFQTAVQDAAPDSLLAQLAEADKQLAEAGNGRIIVSSSIPEIVRLSVRQNGKEVALIEVDGQAEVDIPAGETTLILADPRNDCRLSQASLRLTPGSRRRVELEWLWQPGPGEPLWGLLPQPATGAVGARWQLHLRWPTQGTRYLAYSGDGKRFATASTDGVIRVFDTQSRSLAGILPGPPHDFSGLAWSPNPTRLVASGYDGAISGWDTAAMEQVFRRSNHPGAVKSLSSTGTQHFSAGGAQSLRIWSESGEEEAAWKDPDGDVLAVALCPDGKWAAVRSWSPAGYPILRVFDRQNENAPRDLNTVRESDYTALAFSPDSQLLAAGSNAERISVWRTADWSRAAPIQLEGGAVNQLVWQSDSRHLFVLVNYNGIYEVDLQSDPPSITRRWLGPFTRMALSPRDDQMIVANGNGSLLRLDLKGDQQQPFGNVRREILTIAPQPGGKLIAAAGVDAVLRLLDDQGRVIATAKPLPPGRQITRLAWKPDGSLLAGGVNDKSVVIWRADGSHVASYEEQVGIDRQTLGWTGDGKHLITRGSDGTERLIDPAAEPAVAISTAKHLGPAAIDRTNAGWVIKADTAGKIVVTDAAGMEMHSFSLNPPLQVTRIAGSPAGDRLAILNEDAGLSVWSMEGQQLPLAGAQGSAEGFAWSPTGARLAVSTRYHSLQIWDDEGKLEETFTLPHGGRIGAVIWLDESRIMTGGEDAAIRIWDVNTKRAEINTLLLPGHAWARFAASGRLLEASASIEDELVYAVERPRGPFELLSPSEFEQRVARRAGVTNSTSAPAPASLPSPPTPSAERSEERLEMAELGQLQAAELTEVSGIARCAGRDDALWMHNDSGEARLDLVGYNGQSLARFKLRDATIFDWEDMAAFRKDEQDYLLIGDIGDNKANRDSLKLFLAKEPEVGDVRADITTLPLERTIEVRYEDGKHDCEAIAVDAERNVALLLTKELDSECSLFELPLDGNADQPVVARRIAKLPLPLVTAMDISPDGKRLVVLGGVHAFEYVREDGENWTDALVRVPHRYALPPLAQPEAIAYDRAGSALLVTSEGEGAPLWRLILPAR